jgi:tetratricopeptide (TPR) repeat protein
MDRIATLQEFLREDPDDPFTRFALAQEFRKAGRLDEAAERFAALVEAQPDYVGTYYHLAALYRTLGRDADAIATLRTGIAVATRLPDPHARAELQSALLEAEGLGADDF